MLLILWLILLILLIVILPVTEGFSDQAKASKCYSCERQDQEMGMAPRDYGSKCISCEVQDRNMGIVRGYGVKWA